MSLGTIIVAVLAVLFFGGIIVLARTSRQAPNAAEPEEVPYEKARVQRQAGKRPKGDVIRGPHSPRI